MNYVILANREDLKNIEMEEQFNFVLNILKLIGIPLDDIVDDVKDFSAENKFKLREILEKFNVLVLDDRDGGIKIFVEKELIADWKKARFELCVDHSELDPRKKSFIKIYIEYWTIFEKGL